MTLPMARDLADKGLGSCQLRLVFLEPHDDSLSARGSGRASAQIPFPLGWDNQKSLPDLWAILLKMKC